MSAVLGRCSRMAHALAAWRNAEAYFRWRSRSGEPIGMHIPGLGEALFASRCDHVREFLKMPSTAFAPPMPNPIAPVVGEGSIILLDGDPHRRERARFLPALHGERIRRYADVMAEAATDEMATWRVGAVIDARDAAQSITLHIIIRAVFGVEDKERRDELVRLVKSMMRAYIAPFMFFPLLRRAPAGLGPWRRFSRFRMRLIDILSEEIAQRRRCGTEHHDDVLSILLADDEGGARTDDQVRQQLITLLVSGHETTATTVAWALYHIHRDDSVRRRLLDELADHPTPDEMSKLPYLGAVISETLRLHPTVSIVVRQLKSPIGAWQTKRKEGDVVGVALPALHSDPEIWPHPRRFDPDRFLSHKPMPFEYSPFGYGHRRCPGAAFANLELPIVLGTILTGAELQMSPRDRRHNPPRSIPRGVAAVPNRKIRLAVMRTDRQTAPNFLPGTTGITQARHRRKNRAEARPLLARLP